ncbi:putative ankyrin repeat-containing domain, PGG domain-containing protein [Medicago truncatula]|uniref:Putative ankyrin repeat-containing domain, PGG domain-containing protein n=1 Tax=Medicago truncatula TaxID=3880 RepID=A0A396J9X3_MEDTR|nr:putative ankyrin repeat-containing domain, PGG domain-containing protein [Medicago truncatula]
MEMVSAFSVTSPSQSQAHEVHQLSCPTHQLRHPSLHLLQDKNKYLDQCVPLYKKALEGDWNASKGMIDRDIELLNAAITKDYGTLLHVAAETNHTHFVEELVKLLDSKDLELQNNKGNTTLCLAAVSGNLQIVVILREKNGCLPHIRGAKGMTPLTMAAFYGRNDIARYLYNHTREILEEEEWNALFFLCINNDLYGMKSTSPFLELVRCLWDILLNHGCTETHRTIINQPSKITFDATKVGNFHFVAELLRSEPDLIRDVDDKNRSIFHIAVQHCHSSIFSLIHELGSFKDSIIDLEDDERNNILHYAAKLAPPSQLNLISGAALQMTHEILWFEEVKELMSPIEIKKKNSNGKTPDEIFAEEHKELLTKAESWIESITNYCILISTLIFTGVFTATFNIPGGFNKNTGTPNYLQKQAFLIFAVSNATALISSSISMLIFLSIIISSYAEYEYFKSLPSKLLCGLIAQIISITSMMIAFSVSFFITYFHGLMSWVPYFISVFAFIPIVLFKVLVFPLWSDIIRSSYFCMSLFQPRKKMLN